jgi:hypothetical protein
MLLPEESLGALDKETEGAVLILELKWDSVTLYLPTFGTYLSNLTKLAENDGRSTLFFLFREGKSRHWVFN